MCRVPSGGVATDIPGEDRSQAQPAGGLANASGEVIVTRAAVEHLVRTRPWVAFISVLGFAVCGLLVLIGLLMMLLGGVTDELGLVGGILLGLLYLVIAAVYLIVALHLYRFAAAIKAFAGSPGSLALEQAFGQQRAFWRLVGIIAIVVASLYAVLIAIALLVAIVTALMGSV